MTKSELVLSLNNYHFENEEDRSKYEEELSRFCREEEKELEYYLCSEFSIETTVRNYSTSKIYFDRELQDELSREVVSCFIIRNDFFMHNKKMTFYFDKEKKYFYKETPKKHRKISINLIDYLEDKIARDFIRTTVEKFYSKETLKLLDEIEKQNYAYRISINTILNAENRSISDIVTVRNRYEMPKLTQNDNLISLMIARAARKEVTEKYYSEFLNYLSTIEFSHHIYSCLRDMKDLCVYDFLYKKIFDVDLSDKFNYDINHYRTNKEQIVREKNYFLSDVLNRQNKELEEQEVKCA